MPLIFHYHARTSTPFLLPRNLFTERVLLWEVYITQVNGQNNFLFTHLIFQYKGLANMSCTIASGPSRLQTLVSVDIGLLRRQRGFRGNFAWRCTFFLLVWMIAPYPLSVTITHNSVSANASHLQIFEMRPHLFLGPLFHVTPMEPDEGK